MKSALHIAALAFALVLVAGGALAQPSELDQLIASGEEYYRNAMYRQAVASFRQAYTQDPKNLQAAKGLGNSAMQLQDWRNAKSGFETAHELAPEDCSVTNSLAYVYLALKIEERAKATYEEIVGKAGSPGCDPGNNFAKVNLANLYLRSRNDEEKGRALQILNQVVNAEAQDTALLARAHFALGTLYRQNKNYDLAIQHLERTYEYDPAKLEGRYNLGLLYFNKQQFDKALVHLELAYAEQENDYNTNLMLGLVHNEMPGGKEKAREYLERAVELIAAQEPGARPEKNLPHRYLGNIYNDVGEPAKAVEVIEAALPLVKDASERAGLLCTKAKALEKQGRYQDAMDIFESIVDDPQWGNYALTEIKRQESLIARDQASPGR